MKPNPFNRSLCTEMKKIIIAIDGKSSTGKSTLAKQLAAKLHYTYVDSGAMYRAITLYFLKHQINIADETAINTALSHIVLTFEQNKICLNGESVEQEIRKMEISNQVSEVSALAAVRTFAVRQQQQLGLHRAIVMDGRDIGTTVFPDAELKIFLTADASIRAQRRHDELQLKGDTTSLQEVMDNLSHRDLIDSTREISPLIKAEDAVVLNNSDLSMDAQLQIAFDWAMKIINA